ncbi:MAG: pseudouridine synthase Rsu [Segetibacter sp.]|nr:pseudouridine synthase Rsu [Segetibacter sp.]
MNPENEELVSLNKVVSGSGFCSRREADKLIEAGRVTINNKTSRKGAWVKPGDVVAIDGEKITTVKKNAAVYIAFNKPAGITSTTDPKDKSNIINYIDYPKRIFPVGRLDKESDGLIFLTNDGDIVNKILRASNNHEKEYIVTVDKPVDEEFVRKMSNGIPILDEVTKKCYVRAEGARRFRIMLTQGLNRQIRRMCEYLGYEVHSLTRVRIMNISLGNLGVGKWRYFTAPEIEKMNEMITDSSKTDQSPPKNRGVKNKPEKEPINIEVEEEPLGPIEDYEEVSRPKKKTVGNQWWSDNKRPKGRGKEQGESFKEGHKAPLKKRRPAKGEKPGPPKKAVAKTERPAAKTTASNFKTRGVKGATQTGRPAAKKANSSFKGKNEKGRQPSNDSNKPNRNKR